jgi:hypothetical protein
VPDRPIFVKNKCSRFERADDDILYKINAAALGKGRSL